MRGSFSNCAREFCQSVRRDTRLLRFVVDVDLDQYVERVGIFRALIRKSLRDLGAIERLHPLKVARDVARLVRLNRADEVPLQRQIAKGVDFRQCIIQVVLAEFGDAARLRPLRIVSADCVFDAATRRIESAYTTISLGGLCNALLDGGDVVADRVHGGCVNGVAV